MKVGDMVVLLGLVKAKHLNGTLATIVRKHDGGRWIVVVDDNEKTVRYSIATLPFLIIP